MPVRRTPRVVVKKQRPSLIGTAARTAVIAGTATATAKAVSGAMSGAQQQAAQQQAAQQQMAEQQASQEAPVQQQAAPEAGVTMDEKISLLKKLGELKAAGILTDEEFETEKAKILAS